MISYCHSQTEVSPLQPANKPSGSGISEYEIQIEKKRKKMKSVKDKLMVRIKHDDVVVV